jgi:voltage-gated potassium channel Kch
MRTSIRWILLGGAGVVVLVVAVILLASGGGTPSDAAAPEEAARVLHQPGSNVARIVVSADGARRLDLRTARVASAANGTTMPYAALLYDASGQTYAYVQVKRLTFERQRVVVDEITGERVLLKRGPAAGSAVVVVGSQELLGVESGVEDE